MARASLRQTCAGALLAAIMLASGAAASEDSKGSTSAKAESAYADAEAGYSMKIPGGWRKVTEKEVRQLFRVMLKAFGKQAVEAALQRPPVYFEGPDPKDPMKIRPHFGVGYIPTTFAVEPDRAGEYREMVEKQFLSEQASCEEVRVTPVKISGILSLRIDYTTRRQAVSPLKMLVSHTLIPTDDRTLELVFIFDPSQREEMEKVMDFVLDSFSVARPPEPAWSQRWKRIALLTAAGFAGGVLLGLVLQRFSRKSRASNDGGNYSAGQEGPSR